MYMHMTVSYPSTLSRMRMPWRPLERWPNISGNPLLPGLSFWQIWLFSLCVHSPSPENRISSSGRVSSSRYDIFIKIDHALKVLKSQGLKNENLWDITKATLVSSGGARSSGIVARGAATLFDNGRIYFVKNFSK